MPEAAVDPHALPDQSALEVDPDVIDADLEAGYRAAVWETGGAA